ncbi:serine/arginine-rich splicing factor 4-like [Frankliniella occidentalis]|uniref:Serine/arginine-rich splicing factor 4-like n=1 Tax=Frankliniella occidentalis TaxID=133901 RepID=A0A9C6U8X5_FRAOC|nr:serine/arginine-rich splicing factor 4-like [Frankliniella occidentalis]
MSRRSRSQSRGGARRSNSRSRSRGVSRRSRSQARRSSSHARRDRRRSHSRSRSQSRDRAQRGRRDRSHHRDRTRSRSPTPMSAIALLAQALGNRSSGSNRRLPLYTGKTDYSLFRFRFLEHARQCHWSDRRKGLELSMLLTEDAEAVLRHLPDRKRTDFESLDSALKLRFLPDVNRADAERRYAGLKQKSGQSLRKFAADVTDVTMEAHPGMSQGALQQLMIKAFINGLADSTTKRFVRRKRERFDSLRDALRQAEKEYAADDRGGSPKRVRRASTSPTNKKLDELVRSVNTGHQQLNELRAQLEKAKSASASTSSSDQNRPKRDMSTVSCYSCGEKGHFKWQCPAKNSGRQQQQGTAAPGASQGGPKGVSPGQAPCVVYYVPTAAAVANGLPTQQAPAQGKQAGKGKGKGRGGRGGKRAKQETDAKIKKEDEKDGSSSSKN